MECTALAVTALPVLAATRKRPYLLISEEDLPALREKLSREPSKHIYENYTRRARAGSGGEVEPLILIALMNNDRRAIEAAGRAMMESLRRSRERGEVVLSGRPAPHQIPRQGAENLWIDFSNMRYVHRLMNQYDVIESFGVLSDGERGEFQKHIFWVLDQYMSPRIKEINARETSRKHNFHTDNITIIGTAALCFPEHPNAKQWLDYALTDLVWQMENSVLDGAWWEVPRYHGAVLRSLIPFAWALKRNAKFDLFASAGFRGLLDWLVRCQTPRDRVYGEFLKKGGVSGTNGAESMAYAPDAVAETPNVGDAELVNYWCANLAMAAPAYRQSDPGFAGRLMWGWERAGSPYAPESNLLLAPLVLIDPAIRSVPQKLGSENMPRAGYAVMRSDYDRPDEKYLFFTCGPKRETSHKHRDQNSFMLFAEGVPLALEAGSGPYRSADQELWHKATISHNTVLFGGRDQDMEDGRILKFVSKDAADYLAADASRAARVPQFTRHILFVKPDYFIIWDFIRSYVPAEWLLHGPAREIVKSEHRLEFLTSWDVSLDVHFLLPEGKIEVWEGEGRFGHWQTPAGRGAPPVPMLKYVKVKNDKRQDFLTILHPRKSTEAKLSARLVGKEENVIEVRLGEQVDRVMLFPASREYTDTEQNIRMRGRVAVVRRGPINGEVLLDGEFLNHQDTKTPS